jgi:hypothetical protein
VHVGSHHHYVTVVVLTEQLEVVLLQLAGRLDQLLPELRQRLFGRHVVARGQDHEHRAVLLLRLDPVTSHLVGLLDLHAVRYEHALHRLARTHHAAFDRSALLIGEVVARARYDVDLRTAQSLHHIGAAQHETICRARLYGVGHRKAEFVVGNLRRRYADVAAGAQQQIVAGCEALARKADDISLGDVVLLFEHYPAHEARRHRLVARCANEVAIRA